nr:hypothetical protein Itr_chr03CG06090 [Ipomoea trifida]
MTEVPATSVLLALNRRRLVFIISKSSVDLGLSSGERRPETSRAESRRRGEEAEKPRPEKPRRRGCETKSDNEMGDRRRPERVRWRSCETERDNDTGEKQRARDG